MDRVALLQEVLRDTQALLRAEAAQNKGKVTLDPEIKAALDRIGQAPPSAAPESPTPADAPTPAIARPRRDGVEEGLAVLANVVKSCTRCALHEGRTQTVFGTGNPYADLVFVGEGPGAEEDRQGEPFVGAAGELLTKIIEGGMKMQRQDVYICNVVKCRPPANRVPHMDEMTSCMPFLAKQLSFIKPRVICALGKTAAQALLKTDDAVGKLRGKWHEYEGIPLRVTYHPAYLLRQPADKKKTWEDIQEVMKRLQEGA